jgi:hypothetical protein
MLSKQKKKKVVFITGRVSMPLRVRENAAVYHSDGRRTITPMVTAVRKVSKNLIVFETHTRIYCVVVSFSPEPAKMAVRADTLYACA